MVIENTGNMRPGERLRGLQDALEGNPVRQREIIPSETPGQTRPAADRASLADQLEVTWRTTNRDIQRVQERIVSNQIMLQALEQIGEEIASLRESLGASGEEPTRADLVSQTLRNIADVAQEARFNNVPLIEDLDAEGLGLTRIEPRMQPQVVGQRLLEAAAQVEDRLDEVRQEDAVDHRQLRALEVGLENVLAARDTGRPKAAQEVEAHLEAVRQEISSRGAAPFNLTPDRVLDLI